MTKLWLTFTTLWADLADDKLIIFFLFILENRLRHFIQMASKGDKIDFDNLWNFKVYFPGKK